MKHYHTNDRRCNLIKKLSELWPDILNENTKLHKCLFFYEMFQMLGNKDYDLKCLKAYRNGPVFSDIYGDLKYNEDFFKYITSRHLLKTNKTSREFPINESNLKKALFIVKTHTAQEVSAITHKFELWSKKYKEDKNQIAITIKDITEKDKNNLLVIKNSTPEYSDDLSIKVIENKYFIIKKDLSLNEQAWEKLEKLANCNEIVNPIYVINIDKEGNIIIE